MPFPSPYADQVGRGISEPVVEMMKDLIERGQPIPPFIVNVNVPTATDQIFGAVGRAGKLATSPSTINAGVTYLSITTAGQSAIGFLYAQDQVAKTFYALGFVFAGTAAGFSSSAVLSEACSINKVGVLGETIGEACYRVAEKANKLALDREKKPIPMRRAIWSSNPGPVGFIIPSSNRAQICTIIISNVVFAVTAYGGIKIIRAIWKKVQDVVSKRRQLRR